MAAKIFLESEPSYKELQNRVRAVLQPEETLPKEKKLISAVLSTTAALVLVLDPEGRILLFNSACEKLTGYVFEEVRNCYVWDLFIFENEMAHVKSVFQELSLGQFPNEHVNHWLSRDGGRRLIHWMNTSLVDHTNTVEYIVSTGIDITEISKVEAELRVSRERLNLAVKGSNDGLWDWPDIRSDDMWWSSRLYELLGYRDREIDSSFSGFRALIHLEDREQMETAVASHLDKNIPFDTEIRMKTKKGDYRWFRSRGSVIRDTTGDPLRMAGSLMDIMDQKVTEKALFRRTQDLIQLNQQLQDQVSKRNKAEKALLRKHRQMMADLDLAAKIQSSMIPVSSPNLRSLRVAWRFEPCSGIGGDIFNYQYMGGENISFYMLDVCGHGLSSALIASAASQSIQTHFELSTNLTETPKPKEILCNLDRIFPFERFESFFSVVYLTINHQTGRISYCCAGHPHPILLGRDGTLELLDSHGPVIGIDRICSRNQIEKQLTHGDRIILYSDGFLEFPNPAGIFYGKHRFLASLRKHADEPIQKFTTSLHSDLKRFSKTAISEDDLSLLVIEYC